MLSGRMPIFCWSTPSSGPVQPTATKIREALADTKDFKGVSGTITMGEGGNPVKSMVINKVEGGKFVYVTTVNP